MSTESAVPAVPAVGDIIRVRRNGRTRTLEVTHVVEDAKTVIGLLPYASTYVKGGQYEGSYRGTSAAWFSEIVSAA